MDALHLISARIERYFWPSETTRSSSRATDRSATTTGGEHSPNQQRCEWAHKCGSKARSQARPQREDKSGHERAIGILYMPPYFWNWDSLQPSLASKYVVAWGMPGVVLPLFALISNFNADFCSFKYASIARSDLTLRVLALLSP